MIGLLPSPYQSFIYKFELNSFNFSDCGWREGRVCSHITPPPTPLLLTFILNQDLNSKAKRDGAVTIWGGFGNRGYNCVFPNGGNIAVVNWEVVKVSEVLSPKGPRFLRWWLVKSSGPTARELLLFFYSLGNNIRRETGYRTIKLTLLMELPPKGLQTPSHFWPWHNLQIQMWPPRQFH